MGKFKVDDKIRPTREVKGADGVVLRPGDEFVVIEVEHDDYDGDLDVQIAVPHGTWGDTWVESKDFELVSLDPSTIKIGDVVRLEREDGTLIQSKVFEVDPVEVDAPERTLVLHGIPRWVLIGKDSYTLTAHWPAAPPVPTPKPGTFGWGTTPTEGRQFGFIQSGETGTFFTFPHPDDGRRITRSVPADFVPDVPRPLTVEMVTAALTADPHAHRVGASDDDIRNVARRVFTHLAVLRGEV